MSPSQMVDKDMPHGRQDAERCKSMEGQQVQRPKLAGQEQKL